MRLRGRVIFCSEAHDLLLAPMRISRCRRGARARDQRPLAVHELRALLECTVCFTEYHEVSSRGMLTTTRRHC